MLRTLKAIQKSQSLSEDQKTDFSEFDSTV